MADDVHGTTGCRAGPYRDDMMCCRKSPVPDLRSGNFPVSICNRKLKSLHFDEDIMIKGFSKSYWLAIIAFVFILVVAVLLVAR